MACAVKLSYVLDQNQLYLDTANGNLVIENITYAAPEAAEVVGMVENPCADGWGDCESIG